MSGGRCARGPSSKVLAEAGMTLLELLIVMAMISVLVAVASWSGELFARGWQLRRAGHQLLEDLKAVQGGAEMASGVTLSGGSLVAQRAFLVFDPGACSYAAFRWQDRDGDGAAEADEAEQLWRKELPEGVSFSFAAEVSRRACSNVNGAPASAISFASPAAAPCDGRPCIKFDQHGFSVMGPGAVYLAEGQQSLAITATRPGHFTMCEWRGERWQ